MDSARVRGVMTLMQFSSRVVIVMAAAQGYEMISLAETPRSDLECDYFSPNIIRVLCRQEYRKCSFALFWIIYLN